MTAMTTYDVVTNLVDEDSVTLPTAVAGWGQVMVANGTEWARFLFDTSGTVLLKEETDNIVNTDTNEKFCIYDAGAGIAIKNRLGSTKKVAIEIHYFTP